MDLRRNISVFLYLACYLCTGSSAPAIPNHGLVNLSCDFESDFCSWHQDMADNFNWRRAANGTHDATSGPRSDHTSGHGYFAYTRGADAHQSTWVANLASPYVHVTLPTTFTFWYYMNGDNIGSLRLVSQSADGVTRPLFESRGRRGPAWRAGSVILQIGVYRLMFQASAKYHWSSDVAVDDISITTLLNVSYITMSTTRITTTPTTLPATTTPIYPVTCTFEHNFCGWHQDRHDELDWLRAKGRSPDYSSGPLADHTLQGPEGYYAFLDGRSSQSEGGKGGLTSNFLHVSSPAEFSFWYHMNGPGIGELSLSRMTQGGRLHELWSKHGRQGPDWNLARIMIPRGQYKLVISGTAKQHVGSNIAIDDIVLNTEVAVPIG